MSLKAIKTIIITNKIKNPVLTRDPAHPRSPQFLNSPLSQFSVSFSISPTMFKMFWWMFSALDERFAFSCREVHPLVRVWRLESRNSCRSLAAGGTSTWDRTRSGTVKKNLELQYD